MSQDQAEAPTRSPEEQSQGEAAQAQAGAEARAEPHQPPPEDRRPVKMGRAILLLAVAAAAVAYSGISGRITTTRNSSNGRRSRPFRRSRWLTPKRGGEARELVLPGNVDAFYSATIHGQVKGYVSEWRKDIGAKVKQGDVLAVVDTPELDQSIAVGAKRSWQRPRRISALAKVTAGRWNSLRATAAVSQQAADEKDCRRTAQGRPRSRPLSRTSIG